MMEESSYEELEYPIRCECKKVLICHASGIARQIVTNEKKDTVKCVFGKPEVKTLW